MTELVLITTCDLGGGRDLELRRMLDSVAVYRNSATDVTVRPYLLLQRAGTALTWPIPEWVRVLEEPGRLSLSAARNRMIAAIMADGLDDDTLVAFPDDDAWYPQGTLDFIIAGFSRDTARDFWFCRYGTTAEAPASAALDRETAPSFQQVLSFASSNTVVLRGRVLKSVGEFDEALGVGTPAGGGEDTDFAIRAYFAAVKTVFLDGKHVGHRDGSPAFRARYYRSSLKVIARHAHRSPAARLAHARKLLVGLHLTLTGKLSLLWPGHPRGS